MKTIVLTALAILLAIGVQAYAADEQARMKTGVVTPAQAKTESFDWGQLITYFGGQSYSSKDSLTAVAVINPGMEIHPPHVHSEEEYLMVLEGEGTWSVEGKEFPAKTGDVMYSAPWDEHGLKNTGSTPLKFVVFKWNPKAVLPKAQPKK